MPPPTLSRVRSLAARHPASAVRPFSGSTLPFSPSVQPSRPLQTLPDAATLSDASRQAHGFAARLQEQKYHYAMADTQPGTPARIRVWADDLQRSSWVLLPRAAETVSDIACSVARKLGLTEPTPRAEPGWDVYMGEALVLESEDARLIRDGDEIAIRNKRSRPGAVGFEGPAVKRVRREADPVEVEVEVDRSVPPRPLTKRAPAVRAAEMGGVVGLGPGAEKGKPDGDGHPEKPVADGSERPSESSKKPKLDAPAATKGGASAASTPAAARNPPVRSAFQPTKPRRSPVAKPGPSSAPKPAAPAVESARERPVSTKATVGPEPKGAENATDKRLAPHVNEGRDEVNRRENNTNKTPPRKSNNIYTAGRKTHRDAADRPYNAYFDSAGGRGRVEDYGRDRGYYGGSHQDRREGGQHADLREQGGWDDQDGRGHREQRGHGGRMEYGAERGRGYRRNPVSDYFDTGRRDGRGRHQERGEGRDYRGDRAGYGADERYGRMNRGREEVAHHKAVTESQNNRSFHGGGDPPKRKEASHPPSKAANTPKSAVALDPTSASAGEARKELDALLAKSPPKTPAPASQQSTLSSSVCDNKVTNASCTILDMLADVPRSVAKTDPGLFCRLKILLQLGTPSVPIAEPSSWVQVHLASMPTDAGELCVIGTNKRSLSAIRRSGRAAKQKSHDADAWMRGVAIAAPEKGFPILVDPVKVVRFSFDITGLAKDGEEDDDPVEVVEKEAETVKETEGTKEVPTGYESLATPKTGYENLPSAKTGYESLAQPKTGYENLATPASAAVAKGKPAAAAASVSASDGRHGTPDAQMPDLDSLPPPSLGDGGDGDYPSLGAIDSFLGDLGADAGGLGGGAAKDGGGAKKPPTTGTKAPPRPSSNRPDSVIDLVEESTEVDDATQREKEATQKEKEDEQREKDDFNEFRRNVSGVMNEVQKTLAVLVGGTKGGI